MNHLCLKINLTAIKKNLNFLRYLSPNSKIISVIKANAYGLGADEISRAITDDVEMFAVATIDEAKKIRQNLGFEKPILALSGFLDTEELLAMYEYGVTPLIHNQYQANLLESKNLKFSTIFLKIETGMNRLGLAPDEALDVYHRLSKHTSKIILLSHYHSGGDSIMSLKQANILEKTRDNIDHSLALSIAASDGILLGLPSYDYIRPGISMYGIGDDRLSSAVALTSKIISIKNIQVGDIVGYSATWQAKEPTKIAVISGGYADGLPRSLGNRGQVFVNGKLAPIIGAVSMDRFVVNLDKIEASINDSVEIFGKNNPITRLAKEANTISYELLTNLSGARVDRLYFYE